MISAVVARLCGFSRFFQVCEDFEGVAFGLDLGEDVMDLAVWADDESGADDAHDFLAVHFLFLDDAKGIGDFFIGVGEKGERELEFILEFFLRLRCVGGDAE